MKEIELRRHTANEGDVLTPEGVMAALEISRRLQGGYRLGHVVHAFERGDEIVALRQRQLFRRCQVEADASGQRTGIPA